MPLFDLETMREITEISYKRDYDLYLDRMTKEEVAAIKAWIHQRIDGDEIHTAGWMPGSGRRGTVLEPIYTKAARQNFELSGRCFGLMVYAVFVERTEDWVSGRFELRGRAIGSRPYFRKHPPTQRDRRRVAVWLEPVAIVAIPLQPHRTGTRPPPIAPSDQKGMSVFRSLGDRTELAVTRRFHLTAAASDSLRICRPAMKIKIVKWRRGFLWRLSDEERSNEAGGTGTHRAEYLVAGRSFSDPADARSIA